MNLAVLSEFANGVVWSFPGFNEGLHAHEIFVHVLLGIRSQERGNDVTDRAGRRIVRKTNLDARAVPFRVESDDAGVLNQTARFALPGQQFIWNHLRNNGIPFKPRA